MFKFIAAVMLFIFSSCSFAALYDRGNGMIYDSTQNITWLQDGNYAATSLYQPSPVALTGTMTYEEAKTWAANLVYGGYNDWRLPSAKLIGNDSFRYDGSTDVGPNDSHSEIGHLFFELGNISIYDTTGKPQPNYGLLNTTFLDAATHTPVSFLNVQNSFYWEHELVGNAGSYHVAKMFRMTEGFQEFYITSGHLYAWAVRDGDVAAVPVPNAAILFLSGVIGLFGAVHRRK